MARLTYLELPVADVAQARAFYAAALGWDFTAFGPSYASTMSGDTDVGLQGDSGEASAAALPVVQVDDVAAAEASVRAAGGEITRAAFDFPGGRRFHFRDPDGHELAVMQTAAGE